MQPEESIKTYRPTQPGVETWIILPLIFFTLIEVVGVYFILNIRQTIDSAILAIAFVIFCFFNLITATILNSTRIVTSPKGISYYAGFYEIHSAWENVISISSVEQKWNLGTIRCIVLKNGARLKWWTNLVSTIPRKARGQVILFEKSRIWEYEDELIQDIKKYAPHVNIDS